jgi:hypothetical protein
MAIGCRPSLLTKAAIQAPYSLNVGNVHDTGHSAQATPPAAMADNVMVGHLNLNFRCRAVPEIYQRKRS